MRIEAVDDDSFAPRSRGECLVAVHAHDGMAPDFDDSECMRVLQSPGLTFSDVDQSPSADR